MSRTSERSIDDDVYFGGAWDAAQPLVLKQSYESMSRDGIRRVVNEEWELRLKGGQKPLQKILSKKAKATILADTEGGRYRDLADANEPAYMSPSVDPSDYSLWCSFCYDFGEILLLCAGCRVGLCTARTNGTRQCVVWDPMIHQDDFVFFCPYCIRSRRPSCSLRLTEPTQVPEKWSVLFRYDPRVLIISVRWGKKNHSFGKLLRDRLYLPYTNNEGSVMFVERSIDGTSSDPSDSKFSRSKNTSIAESFLNNHPTAKIIIIVDTHALENGYFLWAKDSVDDPCGCSLLEILRDCTPKGVFKFLSNEEGTPKHAHKSLIVNIACGASISLSVPRSEILQGHCADAVLSLANISTVVSEVANTLTDLITYWVQTFSDYDILMGKVMKNEWGKVHMPIISRRGHDPTRYTTYVSGQPPAPFPITPTPGEDDDHIVYRQFSFTQPGGQLVLCLNRCDQPFRDEARHDGVRLKCTACNSRCTVPRLITETGTTLGSHVLRKRGIVAVRYPQPQFRVHWDKVGAPKSKPQAAQDTTTSNGPEPSPAPEVVPLPLPAPSVVPPPPPTLRISPRPPPTLRIDPPPPPTLRIDPPPPHKGVRTPIIPPPPPTLRVDPPPPRKGSRIPTIPPPPPALRTDLPPPRRSGRLLSVPPPRPDSMTRSISEPGPSESSPSLRIRIPPRGTSGRGGTRSATATPPTRSATATPSTHSATATPPPPSPQELQEPARPPKRSTAELTAEVWKRMRRGGPGGSV